MPMNLPKGLKALSSIYKLRGLIQEAAAGTYREAVIETGVDALKREVLAWWELDFNLTIPDMPTIPGPGAAILNNRSSVQLVDRTQTGMVNLQSASLISRYTIDLLADHDAAGIATCVAITTARNPVEGGQMTREIPIAITSNNQVYLGVQGAGTAVVLQQGEFLAHVQRCEVTDTALYAALIEQRLP